MRGLLRQHVNAREAALLAYWRVGQLDAAGTITDNFSDSTHDWRSIKLEADDHEGLGEALAELRTEVAELRALRERLVLASDADRRRIERDLHEGVQQHLVALAVRLQLAESLIDSDPATAKALLEELGRDVQRAVDGAAQLAQRIYAPLLELGGLAAALRSAAVSAGVPASVAVSAGSGCRPEIVHTVYACWLDALKHAGDTPVAITVREEAEALTFEVVRDAALPDPVLEALRDRIEALGGRLTIRSEPGGAVNLSGSLPLTR